MFLCSCLIHQPSLLTLRYRPAPWLGLAPRVLCQGYATVKPKQRVGRNVVLVEGVRTPFMMSGTEYACLQHCIPQIALID